MGFIGYQIYAYDVWMMSENRVERFYLSRLLFSAALTFTVDSSLYMNDNTCYIIHVSDH
jgi:hypothetical protein